MIHRIVKQYDQPSPLSKQALLAGFAIESLQASQIFFVRQKDFKPDDITSLVDFLTDGTGSTVTYTSLSARDDAIKHDIEVAPLPGVTDRDADELKAAAQTLGLMTLEVTTARGYCINASQTIDLDHLAETVLCNGVVEYYSLGAIAPQFIDAQPSNGRIDWLDLDLTDNELEDLSEERRLALSLSEMQVLREFARLENRKLSEAEVEMVAQTWSEHCYHKSFRANIRVREEHDDGTVQDYEIDGLLKRTIRAATEACNKDWLLSTFIDNAGIIRFDDEVDISFKVETHNHPSALEPFGGANTGVGGVIRDIMGVSAKPIAVTNVLCFGPSDIQHVPTGSLHPSRVRAGVVAGIADYGNKMGIPTVNGAVIYHEGYLANPLVYCGCVGIAPHRSHPRQPQPGDRIIVLGGKTGRDGLRGATFSSLDLDSFTSQHSFASTAVQIGNPIVEKDVLEVIQLARDAGLYHAITDCGAGGLSSAVGEMAEALGAEVELSGVSLKYPGLQPWEIWLSEAQERMVLSVPTENLEDLAKLCKTYGVGFDDIGFMRSDQQLCVHYADKALINLPMALLHEGHPGLYLDALWRSPEVDKSSEGYHALDFKTTIMQLLADPSIASKEEIIRQYDHEVQGGMVLRPLVGKQQQGPGDAAIIKPRGTRGKQGLAISNGINPRYQANPFNMAMSAVDEAIRNCVAVGADPDSIALLDNFCWGNPKLPDRLGALVKAAQGCYQAARLFDAPFISGKDSLNNEYVDPEGQRTAIPGTILISAIAIVPDIHQSTSMDLKAAGNQVYLIGTSKAEFGGSYLHKYAPGNNTAVPGVRDDALHYARKVFELIQTGLVSSCHDLSEGGLAVALAEMALAGELGLHLDPALCDAIQLFSESNTRWLVEVSAEHSETFKAQLEGFDYQHLGRVSEEPILDFGDFSISLDDIRQAWRGQLEGGA